MDNFCKECGTELRILNSHVEVEGDESPDTQTKVYTVLQKGCVNPNCGLNAVSGGGPVLEQRIEMEIGK